MIGSICAVAELRVVRDTGLLYPLMKIGIELDGELVATVRRGQRVVLACESGGHDLQARVRVAGSPKLQVKIDPDFPTTVLVLRGVRPSANYDPMTAVQLVEDAGLHPRPRPARPAVAATRRPFNLLAMAWVATLLLAWAVGGQGLHVLAIAVGILFSLSGLALFLSSVIYRKQPTAAEAPELDTAPRSQGDRTAD
ncbi:hypothetical protein BH10ACT8_BH10ACT8_09630 [soil metagenome]